jgi:hypothetical protein
MLMLDVHVFEELMEKFVMNDNNDFKKEYLIYEKKI